MNHTLKGNTLVIELEGRIDSGNADYIGEQIDDCLAQEGARRVEFDCSKLEYISSAGLRVIMRLLKRLDSVSATEVSPSVYDVLNMTGISQMMNVRKALRRVDVAGLKPVETSVNGSVYRLTKDELVKVYKPSKTYDDVEADLQASRDAFMLGIPCAIPFDTVRCESSYGAVYETLSAKTIAECIQQDPKSLEHYATQSAELLKKLHKTHVSDGKLAPATRIYSDMLDAIQDDFDEYEMNDLRLLLDSIPERDSFIHNDYHPKSVMDSGGELMLIDLDGSGFGNPLHDLIHSYVVFNLVGAERPDQNPNDKSYFDLSYAQMEEFWNIFIGAYCNDERRAKLLNSRLRPWGWYMYLISIMCHPLLPKQRRQDYAKKVRDVVLTRTNEMLYSLRDMNAVV